MTTEMLEAALYLGFGFFSKGTMAARLDVKLHIVKDLLSKEFRIDSTLLNGYSVFEKAREQAEARDSQEDDESQEDQEAQVDEFDIRSSG